MTGEPTEPETLPTFPVVFRSQLSPRVWGGRWLGERLGKPLPDTGPVGESWEISPLEGSESVAENAPWTGQTLSELWRGHPSWRGRVFRDRHEFPWLIKWLDCRDNLSLQVHPDAAASLRLCGVSRPKTEAWIVAHAEPTARIWAGCRPGTTADEFARRLDDGTLAECLHAFAPRAGDCVFLPAGTLHAAGGGLLMAEIQQPSDFTFRLFDWNRLDTNGRPRELHRAAGLESLHWPQAPVNPVTPRPREDSTPESRGEHLVDAPDFRIERWTLTKSRSWSTDEFAVWMVLSGLGHLHCQGKRRPLRAGETLWFPAAPIETTWEPTSGEPLVLLKFLPPAT